MTYLLVAGGLQRIPIAGIDQPGGVVYSSIGIASIQVYLRIDVAVFAGFRMTVRERTVAAVAVAGHADAVVMLTAGNRGMIAFGPKHVATSRSGCTRDQWITIRKLQTIRGFYDPGSFKICVSGEGNTSHRQGD